jgi:hypothetical protein
MTLTGRTNIPPDPNADLTPGIKEVKFGKWRRRVNKRNSKRIRTLSLKNLRKDLKKLKKI